MSFSQDYAWAAGFLDGDGCIQVGVGGRNKARGSLRISTNGCHPFPHKKMEVIFGGNIFVSETHEGALGNKRVFKWQLSGSMAYDALLRLTPFLTEKHHQAVMALEWRDSECDQTKVRLHREITEDKRKEHRCNDTY
jgi:hypothetical protein